MRPRVVVTAIAVHARMKDRRSTMRMVAGSGLKGTPIAQTSEGEQGANCRRDAPGFRLFLLEAPQERLIRILRRSRAAERYAYHYFLVGVLRSTWAARSTLCLCEQVMNYSAEITRTAGFRLHPENGLRL